ncbi:uncharacterized mitochondrial protein-like protein [Tanacetum coccineum]
MVAGLRYFNSLKNGVEFLKSQMDTQRTHFLNEIDRLSREYYYADHMNVILGVYIELDEATNLQCHYMEALKKCECLEKELSKSKTMLKSFEALQKHAMYLELALQKCKEQIKNDKAFKENQSNVFLKERVIPTTSVSRPSLKSNRMEDRVMSNNSKRKKQEVEDHHRIFKRHFKTLCLDELRSSDFNLLSNQEYSKEEEAEAMAETMDQYMSKTWTNYGSGVARLKIENRDQFELKGQFLKELRESTFSDSDNEDANEHIEKVLEIIDLFHVPNITVDQLMLKVFPMSLTRYVSHWLRIEPTGSIKTWEDLKTKFLNKYGPPGQTVKKMEKINNFQQEPDEILYQACERFKELLMKCPQHYLTEMQEIKKVNEKVYVAQVGCEQCKGPYYTKDFPLKEEGKTLEEAYYTQFGGPFQGGGIERQLHGTIKGTTKNPSYQERRQSMEDTLSKFMSESAKRQEENSNLIKEIRATTDAAIRNQGASIKTLEIKTGQMSKVLQERGFVAPRKKK